MEGCSQDQLVLWEVTEASLLGWKAALGVQVTDRHLSRPRFVSRIFVVPGHPELLLSSSGVSAVLCVLLESCSSKGKATQRACCPWLWFTSCSSVVAPSGACALNHRATTSFRAVCVCVHGARGLCGVWCMWCACMVYVVCVLCGLCCAYAVCVYVVRVGCVWGCGLVCACVMCVWSGVCAHLVPAQHALTDLLAGDSLSIVLWSHLFFLVTCLCLHRES
jgi:hypothetical protein